MPCFPGKALVMAEGSGPTRLCGVCCPVDASETLPGSALVEIPIPVWGAAGCGALVCLEGVGPQAEGSMPNTVKS